MRETSEEPQQRVMEAKTIEKLKFSPIKKGEKGSHSIRHGEFGSRDTTLLATRKSSFDGCMLSVPYWL